ncbi:MAG TPA: LysM peptidoglycan-binding domain-containing protein [Patescibacteria group bacterium]|nr:LysM peptidoglycan-binding domain-containing protein [Patescibacteria group bacterium]
MMQAKTLTVVLSVLFLQHIGCVATGGMRTGGDPGDQASLDAGEEMYLLYPQLMHLQERLDTACAYYYMGDLESAFNLSEDLLESIDETKETVDEPAICDHLDFIENKTLCLKQHIADEEMERDWRLHITAVLDSIGENHVVEDEIEITFNWRTDHWLTYFQGKGKLNFQRWLARAEQYRDIIEPILIEMNVPRDLLYLAIIESGLNLNASSRVKAIGPWQFMPGTARLFGLRINWWIDERKDIIASTYAAAHYLKHLHNLFGSWPLALAAYNAGEYRVAHAISQQKTDDYWRLHLPSQTRWFVPKYMAALAIGRDPERYGFETTSAEPLEFDIITIDQSTDLRLIANGCGCTVTTIKDLNPTLKRWATPPDMAVELKVPRGSGEKCIEGISKIPESERVSWHRHQVRQGETLSSIAARYEISMSELKRINSIKDVHRIRAGHMLLIPVKDAGPVTASTSKPSYRTPPSLPDKITMKKYKAPEGYQKIVYTVRDKDTLSEIAERFHVGLSRLKSWNGLHYTSLIHPGDRLVIYTPPGSDSTPEISGADPAEGYEHDGKKQIVHIVKRGETLTYISRLYKTRIADILAWNSDIKRDRLFPGERIKIWMDSN